MAWNVRSRGSLLDQGFLMIQNKRNEFEILWSWIGFYDSFSRKILKFREEELARGPEAKLSHQEIGFWGSFTFILTPSTSEPAHSFTFLALDLQLRECS